jgi:hypothetical protein
VQLSFTFSAEPDLKSMLVFDVNQYLSVELFPTAFFGGLSAWARGEGFTADRVIRKCTAGSLKTSACVSDAECMALSAGKCLIDDAENSQPVFFGNDTSPNPLQLRLPLYSYDFDSVNTSYWLASVVIPDEVSEGVLRATIAANSVLDEQGHLNVQSLPFSLKVDYVAPEVISRLPLVSTPPLHPQPSLFVSFLYLLPFHLSPLSLSLCSLLGHDRLLRLGAIQ